MKYRLSTVSDLAKITDALWVAVDSGAPHIISIDPIRQTRSAEANRRYWALLTAIAQYHGECGPQYFAPEVWHEEAKRRFAGVEAGPSGPVVKSTTRMPVDEFAAYMEKVEAWAATELDGFEFEA